MTNSDIFSTANRNGLGLKDIIDFTERTEVGHI